MRVTIVWYSHSDAKLGEQDCSSEVAAFSELQRLGLNAHAFPTGTTSGLYDWRRRDVHTVDGFIAKMRSIAEQNGVVA